MEQEKQIAVNGTTATGTSIALRSWLNRDNKLISAIIEERISNASVLRMCNASIAFVVMILSANYYAATTVVSLAWFVTAIIDFKTNLK